MQIALATPIRPGSTSGNRVTADRWAAHLTELGHHVAMVSVDPDGYFEADLLRAADVLVALHARRSAPVCHFWQQNRPMSPLIVGLAGTDLYVDLPDSGDTLRSVTDADYLIVLQPAAVGRLSSIAPALGAKAVVIHQSVPRPLPPRSADPPGFRVVVLAHLRDVKDPLLCARATAHLPDDSTVHVEHAGTAHTEEWQAAATLESATNHRYRWHGPMDRRSAQKLLASATVLACTSLVEGGANVVTEAIAMGVPVVGTDIDGNRGLLGEDYPGLVPVGDEIAMAALLRRLETEPAALAELQSRTDALVAITEEATERAAWAALLDAVVTESIAGSTPTPDPPPPSPR